MSINRRSFVRQFGATLGAASLGTTLFPALALGEGFENFDLMNIPLAEYPRRRLLGLGAGILHRLAEYHQP